MEKFRFDKRQWSHTVFEQVIETDTLTHFLYVESPIEDSLTESYAHYGLFHNTRDSIRIHNLNVKLKSAKWHKNKYDSVFLFQYRFDDLGTMCEESDYLYTPDGKLQLIYSTGWQNSIYFIHNNDSSIAQLLKADTTKTFSN